MKLAESSATSRSSRGSSSGGDARCGSCGLGIRISATSEARWLELSHLRHICTDCLQVYLLTCFASPSIGTLMPRVAQCFGLLLTTSLAVVATGMADAQDPPKGPLVILVGFSAGGTTDLIARVMAEKLANALQRPVVVEDKPGAGGRIAAVSLEERASGRHHAHGCADRRARARPARLSTARLRSHARFRPSRANRTISVRLRRPRGSSGKDALAIRRLGEGESVSGQLRHTRGGEHSHFLGVMIARATGIEMTHVPYKGLPALASDLIGGQIPAGIDALPDLIALHRAGKIRILATSGAARSPLSPMVPTFSEQGFASIEATSWVAMYAPANTPDPVVGRLSGVISASLQASELRERLVSLGYEPTGTTPAELAAIMAADTERWAPIIKASGFRAE